MPYGDWIAVYIKNIISKLVLECLTMHLITLSAFPQVLPDLLLLPYHPTLRVSSSPSCPIFDACCYPLEYTLQGRLFKKSGSPSPSNYPCQ